MPANHYIDHDRRVVLTTWEGEASDEAFIESLKRYQAEVICRPDCRGYGELFDVRGASAFNLSVSGIRAMGRMASAKDGVYGSGRFAIVVNSKLAFGLSRMYMAYRSLTGQATKAVNVFRDRESALDWLGVRDPVKPDAA